MQLILHRVRDSEKVCHWASQLFLTLLSSAPVYSFQEPWGHSCVLQNSSSSYRTNSAEWLRHKVREEEPLEGAGKLHGDSKWKDWWVTEAEGKGPWITGGAIQELRLNSQKSDSPVSGSQTAWLCRVNWQLRLDDLALAASPEGWDTSQWCWLCRLANPSEGISSPDLEMAALVFLPVCDSLQEQRYLRLC